MALAVTHAKISAIPDDPGAVAAGEVVPSDWNAAHTISGGTAGSVVFVGSSGEITEDNSNLFFDDANNALTVGGGSGTVTSSSPVFDGSQTWNNGAATFTGIKLNITNTASAAASLLLDLQVGGSSKAAVGRGGDIFGTTVQTGSGGSFGFSSTSSINGAVDTWVFREAAGHLGLYGGTDFLSPSAIWAHNTYSSFTNKEFARFDWLHTSNVLTIGTDKGSGGGSTRNMQFVIGGTAKANYGITTASTWSFLDSLKVVPAANSSAYLCSAYSLTGSSTTPLMDLSGTWNTSGVATLCKLNVTDTGSNINSLLLDLQVNGASVANVNKTGFFTMFGGIADNYIYMRSSSAPAFYFNNTSATYYGALQCFTSGTLMAMAFGRAPSVGAGITGLTFVAEGGMTSFGGWNSASFPGLINSSADLHVKLSDNSAFANIKALNAILTPAASVTPANNGELTFQATSNTSLTFKYKGSDGTVRSGSITLS